MACRATKTIAYADDFAEEFRQAAGYIDRILKGSKVGELPVQQPTKYELVINLRTAKALGLRRRGGARLEAMLS